MPRYQYNSETLIHALKFDAAKSPSRYINELISSHCSQQIPVFHCRYDRIRKGIIQDERHNDFTDVKWTEGKCGEHGHIRVEGYWLG